MQFSFGTLARVHAGNIHAAGICPNRCAGCSAGLLNLVPDFLYSGSGTVHDAPQRIVHNIGMPLFNVDTHDAQQRAAEGQGGIHTVRVSIPYDSIQYFQRTVRRNGKSYALIAVAQFHGHDTDHPAIRIHQRSAGVTGIDFGIGLNGPHLLRHSAVGVVLAHLTVDVGNNAFRGRERKFGTSWCADGIHGLPHVVIVRALHKGSGIQLCGYLGRIDPDDSQIVHGRRSDHRRLSLRSVQKCDTDRLGAVYHVVVGSNIPVGIQNNAGAGTAPGFRCHLNDNHRTFGLLDRCHVGTRYGIVLGLALTCMNLLARQQNCQQDTETQCKHRGHYQGIHPNAAFAV